ncbi:TNF receptor-associated factor 2-like [Rhinoraja longicauda]
MSMVARRHGEGSQLYQSVCVEKMAPCSDTFEVESDGGYEANGVRDYDHKYYCGACGLLMRDPVQTECGHRFCHACHSKVLKELMMCPSCLRDKEIFENGSVDMFEKCFNDRAIAKEILNLEVSCVNQGCMWTGPLRELEGKHKMACEQNLQRCPFSAVGCAETVSGHKMDEHIRDSVQHHLTCILRKMQGVGEEPGEKPGPVGMAGNQTERDPGELTVKLQTFENIVTVLNREVGHTLQTVREQEKQLKEQDTAISRLQSKVRQNERSIGLRDVAIADLQLRLDVFESSSDDGTLVWAIGEVSRRMRDAVDGRSPSILSPPFFTSRGGYKLCLRMYLNGDGLGANTHLSLFLVIVKGKYDPILDWPFSKKVTFKLLDHRDGEQQVVSAFKPDTSSASFHRPRHAMNIASGCPQFMPLAQLRSNWPAFVSDDTMFVKAVVEP